MKLGRNVVYDVTNILSTIKFDDVIIFCDDVIKNSKFCFFLFFLIVDIFLVVFRFLIFFEASYFN